MKITITELSQVCELLFKKTKLSGFNEIDFDTDNYWTIASDEREKFDKEPALIVGSLFDDIEELKKILHKKNPTTIVDFDRLANILVAVGERISRSDKPFLP